MLSLIKTALRITTNSFDTELQLLINAAIANIEKLVGMTVDTSNPDPQVTIAVIAYCKWQFGDNENKEEWGKIYEHWVKELMTMTGYTDWSTEDTTEEA